MGERQKHVHPVWVVILVIVYSLILSLPVIPQERVNGAGAVGGLGCMISDPNVVPLYCFLGTARHQPPETQREAIHE